MGNNLLTINMVTKEAINLFNNSNLFIKDLELYVPSAPAIISLKEVIVLGAAAALIKNPEVSRRFWSGWIK